MNDIAKAAKNRYLREWRRKNLDKVRKREEDYWMKKSKEVKEEQ